MVALPIMPGSAKPEVYTCAHAIVSSYRGFEYGQSIMSLSCLVCSHACLRVEFNVTRSKDQDQHLAVDPFFVAAYVVLAIESKSIRCLSPDVISLPPSGGTCRMTPLSSLSQSEKLLCQIVRPVEVMISPDASSERREEPCGMNTAHHGRTAR